MRSAAGVLFAAALAACAPSQTPRSATPTAEASPELAFALEVRVERWGDAEAFLELPRAVENEQQTLLEEWSELGDLRTEALSTHGLRPLRVHGPEDGAAEAVSRLRYAARLRRAPAPPLPTLEAWPETAPGLGRWSMPTSVLPARSPRVRKFLISRVEPRLEAGATDVVREILAVLDEAIAIDRETAAGPGVLEALRTGVTTPNGYERLLVTCLRTAGIPARLAAGLDVSAPRGRRFLRWTELHLKGRWWPLLPPGPRPLPDTVIELDHGDHRFLPRSEGTRLRFTLLPLALAPGEALGEAAVAALDAAALRRARKEIAP